MEVSAFAPASVSNVSCGFDIMGFALESPGDTVTVRHTASPGVRIGKISGCPSHIPLSPEANTAGPPVAALLRESGTGGGVEIDIEKGIPVGGGIGSSAASAVAAVIAADALLGTRFPPGKLLEFAIEGEKVASGSVHVDNLSPSLWGGFILVRGYTPLDIVRIPVPDRLWCAVVTPGAEIRTGEARKLVPKTIPLADVVTQTGNAAGLVAGLLTGNLPLIGRSIEDLIAEPARRHLIPRFDGMRDAAMRAGALGCGISGSGPSLFALADSREAAARIVRAMGDALAPESSSYVVSRVGAPGARIIT